MFPQFSLFPKLLDFSIHFLTPAYGQFVSIKTSQDEFFKKTFISPRNNLFHAQKYFFLARYKSPNEPHLFRMVQPIRSPENLGTTVVSIGHLTPWLKNPGYCTQVWDKFIIPTPLLICSDMILTKSPYIGYAFYNHMRCTAMNQQYTIHRDNSCFAQLYWIAIVQNYVCCKSPGININTGHCSSFSNME